MCSTASSRLTLSSRIARRLPTGSAPCTLQGDTTPVRTETGKSLYITATGATIISAAGQFTLAGGIVTGLAGQVVAAGDTIVLRAPAAAGTSVVSVYEITTATGIAALEGTMTITWTATSGLNVSEANSTAKLVADATCAVQTTAKTTAIAALPAAVTAGLCLTLKDANGALLSGTPSVAVTITPVGLVHANTPPVAWPAGITGQVVSQNAAAGIANFQIVNTGAVGVATIGISITQGTTVTTFAPKTFTFTGAVASVTATNLKYALDKTSAATAAVDFTAKDASGNYVATTTTATTATSSAVGIFTIGPIVEFTGDPDVPGTVAVDCTGTEGSGTVTITNNAKVSNAVTIYCSGGVDKYTVAFDKTTVSPGGSAILTVTAKDAAGQPAYDAAAAPGIPVLSAGGISTWGTLKNGVSKATYLAPFNAGVVTVLVTMTATTTVGPLSATLTVGKPVLPAVLGSTASTLGVSTGRGAWSTSTKVAKVGEFITWRFAAGVANAGKTIGVFVQTKDSSGVWSAPVRFSARVADSSGNAYFSWKGTKAMWVSVRGGLDDARSTPPVQGRWQ